MLARRKQARRKRDWRIVSAVHGRGTLLLGPLLASGQSYAWVFAPPGVRLATPATDDPMDPPISISGWREALWAPDANGLVAIDHGRPVSLDTCRPRQVFEHVCDHCPEHLTWVRDQLDSRLRTLHLQTRHSASGRLAPSHAVAARALEIHVAESEEALEDLDGRIREAALPGHVIPRAGDLHALRLELDDLARVVEADRIAQRYGQRASRHTY